MYQVIKAYAESHGKYTYKDVEIINKLGKKETVRARDTYIPDNPDEYILIVTDHMALIQPSGEEGTLHKAMSNYSSIYMLECRDRWNYSPIMVVQQAAASEQQQFTFKGDTIIEKLMPSAESLGDNKLIGRDCDLMLGLFWPYRYNIERYNTWNLNKIGNYHRELIILLNRHGISKASIDLYFDGSCNYFKELPRMENESIYNKINEINKNRIKYE